MRAGPLNLGVRWLPMSNPPNVAKDEFAGLVRERFPDAEVRAEDINPAYRSWRVAVRRGLAEAEVSWGPLTGFGGTDLGRPSDDPNTFSPFDVGFSSVAEAEAFLARVLEADA